MSMERKDVKRRKVSAFMYEFQLIFILVCQKELRNKTKSSTLFYLKDPNEDTEWNDILRKKGILPPKETPKDEEEEEVALQQQSVGMSIINYC